MSAPRKKYRVYYVSEIRDIYEPQPEIRKEYMGETVAVSPEQAVNNVRYRIAGKAPNVYTEGTEYSTTWGEFIAEPDYSLNEGLDRIKKEDHG